MAEHTLWFPAIVNHQAVTWPLVHHKKILELKINLWKQEKSETCCIQKTKIYRSKTCMPVVFCMIPQDGGINGKPSLLTSRAYLAGFLKGGVQGEGVTGNPKDSAWENWGTLGSIRGNHTPSLKNPMNISTETSWCIYSNKLVSIHNNMSETTLEHTSLAFFCVKKIYSNPLDQCIVWYIYLHLGSFRWFFMTFMVNVGKYTSPMHPMALRRKKEHVSWVWNMLGVPCATEPFEKYIVHWRQHLRSKFRERWSAENPHVLKRIMSQAQTN